MADNPIGNRLIRILRPLVALRDSMKTFNFFSPFGGFDSAKVSRLFSNFQSFRSRENHVGTHLVFFLTIFNFLPSPQLPVNTVSLNLHLPNIEIIISLSKSRANMEKCHLKRKINAVEPRATQLFPRTLKLKLRRSNEVEWERDPSYCLSLCNAVCSQYLKQRGRRVENETHKIEKRKSSDKLRVEGSVFVVFRQKNLSLACIAIVVYVLHIFPSWSWNWFWDDY